MPLELRPPKVIAKRGQKKIRNQTSDQKHQITVIGCGSTTGHVIPPSVVFAAKNSTICGQTMKFLGRIMELVTMDG